MIRSLIHRLMIVIRQDGRINQADYALCRQDAAEVAYELPIHDANIVAHVEAFSPTHNRCFEG